MEKVQPHAITHLPALENMKREARGSDLVVFVIRALHKPVGVTGVIRVFTKSCENKKRHHKTCLFFWMVHTERPFPFHCATCTLFFYVNALDGRV